MPAIIDGTNGVTTPNVLTSSSGVALTLQSGGTTAVTIDTSQNVGIGTASPSYKLDVLVASNKNIVAFTPTSSSGISDFSSGGVGWGFSRPSGGLVNSIYTYNTAGGNNNFVVQARSDLVFTNGGDYTNAAESMRVTSGNRVLVGKTAAGDFTAGVEFQPSGVVLSYRTGNVSAIFGRSNDGETVRFYNVTSTVGTISTTSSSTAYNTSSDYRLKENITPMTGALAKVALLKPVTYKWKLDGSNGEGFIAHELAEVKPDCVSGDKDAIDADGNPVYQGIDTSFLVATLTAAIQELKTIVDAQSAEIAELKAKVG